MATGGGRAGTGYIEIRPELVPGFAKDVQKDVDRKLGRDGVEVPVAPEVDDAKTKAAGTKLGEGLMVGVAGVGALAGQMLMDDFNGWIDSSKETSRIAGALGLDADGKARLTAAANEVYTRGLGGSLNDAAVAVEAVGSSLGDVSTMSTDQLADMAAAAQVLADTYGVDVATAASVAGQAAEEFGLTGMQSLDLLAGSLEGVDANLRGDLLEAIDEYTPMLKELGYTADEAFTVFATAAKEGKFELDKMPDAIKELHNRMLDLEHMESNAGLQALGIPDPIAFKKRIMAGGAEAKSAVDMLLNELMAKKDDPRAKQWAMNIFGTQFEDLASIDTLALLKPVDDAILQTQGKAMELEKAVNDNVAGSWDRAMRRWEIDRGEGLDMLVSDFGGSMGKIAEGAGQVVEKVELYFMDGLGVIGETLGGWIDTVEEAFGEIPGWLGGLWENIEDFFGKVPEFLGGVADGVEDFFLGPIKGAWNSLAGWLMDNVQIPELGPFTIEAFGRSLDIGPFGPFDAFPSGSIPTFDTGGVVGGGRIGDPQLILAHVGETVLPTHKPGFDGGAGKTQNNTFNVNGANPAEATQVIAATIFRQFQAA